MAAALVTSKSAQGSNVTTVTTASVDTTGVDALIVHVANDGRTHTSVTDNKSNTYTAVGDPFPAGYRLRRFQPPNRQTLFAR
jgi:hypothetical protein